MDIETGLAPDRTATPTGRIAIAARPRTAAASGHPGLIHGAGRHRALPVRLNTEGDPARDPLLLRRLAEMFGCEA